MRPKIYLFGDSITEESFNDGWGSSLANHFCRTFDIVLRGYSGYNTRWILKVLDRAFPPPVEGHGDEPPKAITVFFGAKAITVFFGQRSFGSVFLHAQCISILWGDLKQWPGTLVILITPPPIDEEARLCYPYLENPSGLPERTNDSAGSYAKACVEVAGQCGCPVIDLWTKMQQSHDWKKAHLRDGLHLKKSGNKVVFDAVLEKLKEEGISLETMPCDFPMFRDIDPKDPLKAFED